MNAASSRSSESASGSYSTRLTHFAHLSARLFHYIIGRNAGGSSGIVVRDPTRNLGIPLGLDLTFFWRQGAVVELLRKVDALVLAELKRLFEYFVDRTHTENSTAPRPPR